MHVLNIIQNLVMDTILNSTIYMFVKLKGQTWIIFNTISLSHHQGNL